MELLQGKNIIITGATRGIGKSIAILFAQHGANIAFTYLSSDDKAKELEKRLSQDGCKAIGFKSDASDFGSAQILCDTVIQEFGTIDVLVNNAGVTRDGLLMRKNSSSH